MDLKKIIKETIQDFYSEDVGDEYLKRKYGMSGEFDKFEKSYKSQKSTENDVDVIHTDDNWRLLKNPSSLEYIGDDARGVIMPNGDLYIESYGGLKIHNDILKILAQKGVLSSVPKKNWTRKLPQESGFLTVQRYNNSPYIAIGESNRLLYDEEDYNENIDHYRRFINAAKSKNPNLNFVDKLVGTKFLKTSNTNTTTMNESYLK